MKDVFQNRVIAPLKALLLQGITPEKLALSLAIGSTLACIPLLFTTTLLCIAVAAALRLNHVAIQVANNVVYPLQLVFLVPFFRAGEWLFNVPPAPLAPLVIFAAYKANVFAANKVYFMVGLRGVAVWAMFAPVVVAALYSLFLPLIRRMNLRPTQPSS